MNKFLIILAYYERPNIFINALHSINNINYDNFEVHLIDDGSIHRAEPIVRNYCSNINVYTGERLIEKFKFYYIDNTVEQKIIQGGSIHGMYLNNIIYENNSDHVIILCDDDAIYPNFLEKLNQLLIQNPNEKQYYHHLAIYDPLKDFYLDKIDNTWSTRNYHVGELYLPYNVDSSQVTFSRKHFVEDKLKFPFPQTANLDSVIFKQMYEAWGLCKFSGLHSQVKGDNYDRLGYREEKHNNNILYITNDIIKLGKKIK